MENREVMVVYKWTAKEGRSEELKAIYREVEGQMKLQEKIAQRCWCEHFFAWPYLKELSTIMPAGN